MRLLHCVNLEAVGGVEHQFLAFVRRSTEMMDLTHDVMLRGYAVHDSFRAELNEYCDTIHFDRYRHGIHLPRKPAAVRRWHLKRILARSSADLVVLWNGIAGHLETVRLINDRPCVYWDRGSSWTAGSETRKAEVLARVPYALSNSTASQRMLELRWHYKGQLRVCRNALRPTVAGRTLSSRDQRPSNTLTIGVAARLVGLKGVALALHALRYLHRQGIDARLLIAGTGPAQGSLQALVQQLEIDDSVVFAGLVDDMTAFYSGIDCLLHLPLRESFGGVALEAMACGCPVVASGVDGLPEIVRHQETGWILRPELDLQAYVALGGSEVGLPPYMYDPYDDGLSPPRAVRPEAAAQAILDLTRDRARYRYLCEQARRVAYEVFDYDRHVAQVVAYFEDIVQGSSADTDR